MHWYLDVLKKYAEFNDRARRQEYWFFTLFNVIVSIVLALMDGAMGSLSASAGVGLLSGIYALAVFIPSLAVLVRRLHDTGRTGWWVLLCFIPLIGVIVILVFLVLDSDPGANEYGPNPKGEGA